MSEPITILPPALPSFPVVASEPAAPSPTLEALLADLEAKKSAFVGADGDAAAARAAAERAEQAANDAAAARAAAHADLASAAEALVAAVAAFAA